MTRALLCWFFRHRWQRVRRWVRSNGSVRVLRRCQRCGLLRLSRTARGGGSR